MTLTNLNVFNELIFFYNYMFKVIITLNTLNTNLFSKTNTFYKAVPIFIYIVKNYYFIPILTF